MNRAIHHRPVALGLAAASLALGLAACNYAESKSSPATNGQEAVEAEPTVSAGESLVFTVDDDVTSDGYRPGDRFTATLSRGATGADGQVVLPMGTKSHWLVIDALEQGTGTLLAARLEAVQVGEDWYPVQGTITQAHLGPAGEQAAKEPGPEGAMMKTGSQADSLITAMTQGRTDQVLDTTAMNVNDMTGDKPAALIAVTAQDKAAAIPIGSTITVKLSDKLVIGPSGQGQRMY